MNTANSSASAVSACSPPDSSDRTCSFLPGGLAMISRPASSGSSDSVKRQMGAAAAEQPREQHRELLVDLLEGCQQPLPALAVESR